MRRGRTLGLSALAVGAAALVGYVARTGRSRRNTARARASVGARIVEDVPSAATVVDSSSRRLAEIPGALQAVDRAVGADEPGWVEVTFSDTGAWNVVDTLRGAFPYYDGDDGEYNGVYVRRGNRIVVVDAIGWARVEEAAH